MQNKIIFLGDSLTEWGKWNEIFPKHFILNYGIHRDKTDDILKRLNVVCQQKANKIFLMAGINDLGEGRSAEFILMNYTEIVKRLACSNPLVEVFLLSILPVDFSVFLNPKLKTEMIPVLNRGIRQIAEERNAVYIDMYADFETKGKLNASYTFDGLHLNEKGYAIWKKHVEKYMAANFLDTIMKL